MHQTFLDYKEHLHKQYPSVPSELIQNITPNLISPFTLRLPREILTEAKNIVSDIHRLIQSGIYQEKIKRHFPYSSFQQIPSLLCSLDVHVNEEGHLKIIEINTNASSFLINAENYASRGLTLFQDAKNKLAEGFQNTFAKNLAPGRFVVILDENPTQQNMYIEFLLFQSFLKQTFSIECEIAAPEDLQISPDGALLLNGKTVDAIYNRFCDFYLKDVATLSQAYQTNKTLLSPNPWGYALLADKNRLVEWNDTFFAQLKESDIALPFLQKALLTTRRFSEFKDFDEVWSQRAKYFFKPPNAYGGKSVYKGKSISRGVFQRIAREDYLAQKAIPAPEVTMTYLNENHTFKYDLRFYFFSDEIQLGAARLYQGQITNLQTPLGGLTPLEFI